MTPSWRILAPTEVGVHARSRDTRQTSWRLVEGSVELSGMVAEPAPPDGVIRSAGGDDGPEARPVTEHPQVSQLVDDDGLECLGRGQDQTPRECKTALARGTPPARTLVSNADREGRDIQRDGVSAGLAVDGGTGADPQPRFEHGRNGAPIRRRQTNDQFVLIGPAHAFDTRSSRARASRLDTQSMQVAAKPNHGAVTETAARRKLGPLVGVAVQVPVQPLLTLGEEFMNMRYRI
jgi:hypothetical protein